MFNGLMPDKPEPLTANQLIGYNLARIRKTLGLSQEEAAARLEPYLGTRWAKNVYSAAERSYAGKRVRHFTGDELLAMALAFGVPVVYFLLPPRPEDEREGAALRSGDVDVSWPELWEALLGGRFRMAVAQRAFERPRDERVNMDAYLARILGTFAAPRSVEEGEALKAWGDAQSWGGAANRDGDD